ncbi:hypothetical protein M9H77_14272 [Catharanthus roseus]|uniref:Uncharacterized protein n=1 Tax=Catharanthus roseus TaxID=4058 RepID=A0ACC0BMR5_CATRO|nr:hypothetical protein M9H77_14272 [Catharanthus roseus]
MNEQNELSSNISIPPVILPAKRKRGRPRKDGNLLPKKDEGSSKPPSINNNEGLRIIQQNDTGAGAGSMIGRMVSGVIDGTFDAGYFLSVRIGNSGPFLRGVIFEPGRFTPVTSTNDIAPQTKMFPRTEVRIPIPSCPQNHQVNDHIGFDQSSIVKQPNNVLCQVLPQPTPTGPSLVLRNQSSSTMVPVVGNNMSGNISCPPSEKMAMQQTHPGSIFGSQFHQSSTPVENLRMVEQDDAMQVYEVSVQSEGLLVDTNEPAAKDMISESSSEPRANNILHHKEIISNQVDDMVSGLDQSQARIHNDFDCLAGENHIVALESESRQSEIKQNQDPYYELHQHTIVSEPQTLPQKLPAMIESGFQPREPVDQNKLQCINLELHETPVITQTHYVPSENQHMAPGNEIRRPDHDRNENSVNMEDQLHPGSKNHGIQEAFLPSNSHLLHRELLSQSIEFITEKPHTPKNDMETAIQLQPDARNSENSKLVDSQTAERRTREAMPFDLEIAAEETTWHGRPQNQVSGFTAELNLVPGNDILRTETENNPSALPES